MLSRRSITKEWRVPTHNELISLLWSAPSSKVLSNAWGHIDPSDELERQYREAFLVHNTWLWSSTQHPKSPDLILSVDFGDGCLVHLDQALAHHTRLVSHTNRIPPYVQFENIGEGDTSRREIQRFVVSPCKKMVRDTNSGLLWMRDVLIKLKWPNAMILRD